MLTQTRSEIDRATLPPILIDFAGYKGGIENRSKLTVGKNISSTCAPFSATCAPQSGWA